jgi:hypothetical protein
MSKPPDLIYDGQKLVWNGHGQFKATSGMVAFQMPIYQCNPDAGPIPEGLYSLQLKEDTRPARNDGTDSCTLVPSTLIQRIPRGNEAGECEPYWANWGFHRVRIEPADDLTKRRCSHRRAGFHIHDSTKGFTHGCIEVEGAFFSVLHAVASRIRHSRTARASLLLRVAYVPGRPTNGGTKVP